MLATSNNLAVACSIIASIIAFCMPCSAQSNISSRYLLTEEQASGLLHRGTDNGVLQWSAYNPTEGPLGFRVFDFTVQDTEANKIYGIDRVGACLSGYRDQNSSEDYQSYLSEHTSKPSVADEVRITAQVEAKHLLQTIAPDIDLSAMKPFFCIDYVPMLTYVNIRPDGVVDRSRQIDIRFVPISGKPFLVTFEQPSRHNLPHPDNIVRRDDAMKALSVRFVSRLGAQWCHEWKRPLDVCEDIWQAPTIWYDPLGVPRLVYRFTVAVGRTKDAPTWDQYSDAWMAHHPEPEGVERLSAQVDAVDEEVLPGPMSSVDDYINFGGDAYSRLDGLYIPLNYPVIVRNNEPYIYAGYLDNTPLWAGILTRNGMVTTVRYGSATATATTDTVTVSLPNGDQFTGLAPLVVNGRTYLHYKTVAALTGDTITWDARSAWLDINTHPKATQIPPTTPPESTVPPVPVPTDPQGFLKAKDYAKYLTMLDVELAPAQHARCSGIEALTRVAIALDKTDDPAAVERAKTLIADAPDDIRYLDALRHFLKGETKMLDRLLEDPPIPHSGASQAAWILGEQGYPQAATAMRALDGSLGRLAWPAVAGDPRIGIGSLFLLPTEPRQQLQDIILTRLADNPEQRETLARCALRNAILTATSKPDVSKLALEFAIEVGAHDDLLGLADLQETYLKDKALALKVAQAIADGNATNARVQFQVGTFLLATAGDRNAQIAVYQTALQTVQEPDLRDIRACYVWSLRGAGRDADIVTLQTNPDALLAAEALREAGKYDEAAAKCRGVLTDANTTLGRRAAAWVGLLETAPADAFTAWAALIADVGKAPESERGPLARWLGVKLWCVVAQVSRIEYDRLAPGRPRTLRSLGEPGTWETTVAAMMRQLIAVAPDECLTAQRRGLPLSLRVPAATMYALANSPAEAMAVLRPSVNPGEPRSEVLNLYYGESGEGDARLQVLTFVGRTARAAMLFPALLGAIADDANVDVGDAVNWPAPMRQGRIGQARQCIGATMPLLVKTLDPKAATLPADWNTALHNGIQTFIAQNPTSSNVQSVCTGIISALGGARQPQVLDGLFAMLMDVMDQYKAACRDPYEFRQTVANLQTGLDNTALPHLKPYADKLREKYPPKP
jgi:hypothetical protein